MKFKDPNTEVEKTISLIKQIADYPAIALLNTCTLKNNGFRIPGYFLLRALTSDHLSNGMRDGISLCSPCNVYKTDECINFFPLNKSARFFHPIEEEEEHDYYSTRSISIRDTSSYGDLYLYIIKDNCLPYLYEKLVYIDSLPNR